MKTSNCKSLKVVYKFSNKKKMLKKVEQARMLTAGTETDLQTHNADNETLKNLMKIGITKKVAQEIIKKYPEEKIKTQIEALPFRNAKDSAAFLIQSIKEEWSSPAEYKNHIEAQKQTADNKAKKEKEKRQELEYRKMINNYIGNLSEEERENLEEEARERALQDGGDFIRKFGINEGMLNAYLFTLVEEKLGINKDKQFLSL